MRINDLNTQIENLIRHYDATKHRYAISHNIGSIESARYWRYDGVVTGLEIAWKIINNIQGDYRNE